MDLPTMDHIRFMSHDEYHYEFHLDNDFQTITALWR